MIPDESDEFFAAEKNSSDSYHAEKCNKASLTGLQYAFYFAVHFFKEIFCILEAHLIDTWSF